jgi:molybdate transport system substrate-binding protein
MNRTLSFRTSATACLLALAWLGALPFPVEAGNRKATATITVFAASSATDVMTSLAKQYEATHPVRVRLSFAASSVLARQVERDAPCDLVLLADQKWMDFLAGKRKVQKGSRKDIAGNRLVVVTPANKPLVVRMEPKFDLAAAFKGRLAVGDPDHVPAGLYAKEALQNMGWWDLLKFRLAPAENVRAALRLVELGEVEVGIVYRSDARSSGKVVIAGQFPPGTHRAIRYPAALCASATPGAGDFLDYIAGKEAAPVWTANGFDALDQ